MLDNYEYILVPTCLQQITYERTTILEIQMQSKLLTSGQICSEERKMAPTANKVMINVCDVLDSKEMIHHEVWLYVFIIHNVKAGLV